MSPLSRFLLLAVSIGAAAMAACSLAKRSTDTLCTPNKEVYCRCLDRTEGTKTCNSNGDGFGTCEPCTLENPEDTTSEELDASRGPRPAKPTTDAGVDAEAQACGNGIVEPGEDCDDGNSDDSDGCSANCAIGGPRALASAACPGLEVHVWGGAHRPVFLGSTVQSGNRSVSPPCEGSTGSTAPDRVFRVVAHAAGTLEVILEQVDFDAMAYIATTCVGSNISAKACSKTGPSKASSPVRLEVSSGSTTYVFVDGYGTQNQSGTFRLSFALE